MYENVPMVSHKGIWSAVDALAARYGLSPSGLAKKAGLDPTTFNVSKRVSREGKPRWPSTESISKILDATDCSLGEFIGLISDEGHPSGPFRVPVASLTEANGKALFDGEGLPAGPGWDEVAFPDLKDPSTYALEVAGSGMEPIYRDGDILVVSPAASIRRGDRVIVKTRAGETIARQLVRRTARRVELQSLGNGASDHALDVEDVQWMARIVWASQ
jgi:phage repressor protein C with HTH and peptisase S24 domain